MISRGLKRTTAHVVSTGQRFQSRRWIQAETNIKSLGLEMPEPAVPKGNFVNYVEVNGMAYLSGHLPQPKDGALVIGRVGEDLTVEQGYEAAKFVGLNLLATLKHNLGDLDRVKRVVKLFGLVNCPDGFTQQPAVVNGCSDLMVKVFGPENGSHTRSAVGTNALPMGVAVEIEAVFELHPAATATVAATAVKKEGEAAPAPEP